VSGTPIAGYVVAWDVPSGVVADERGARHRLICERHALDDYLTLGLGAPLAVQHSPIFTSRGVQASIGTMRHFRPDAFGLLALGDLDDSEVAASVERSIRQGWLWAFSVGWATDAEIPLYPHGLVIPTVRMTRAAIREVSVTERPGWPDAKILGVGETAEFVWDHPDLASVALQARGDLPPSPRSRVW
jgi:phage head maturation protease